MVEIQVFGGTKEVTGSCYSLATKDEKIIIDCGMFQGSKDLVRMNYDDFAFDPREYKSMILTHAHLDHCGRIPKLVKYGFRGNIYCTKVTRELAFVVMMDAAKIAMHDTEHENKRRAQQGLAARKPLYSEIDVKNALKLFKTVDYGEDVKISKNIIARFYDAGHILGAASVQLAVKDGNDKKIIVFSGDLGQANSILVRETEPITKTDYAFIESTYGDRLHPPREERRRELIRIINETYKRGGKLMIPSFAVERAQEIIYLIGRFLKEGLIPKMNVYLDSPMAMKATEVFSNNLEYVNDEIKKYAQKNKDLFSFPGLIYTSSVAESKQINGVKQPCIIIAGNGMCSAGRIKHHIRNNISDPKNTLLFIGYQAQGTLGYWIKRGEKTVKLLGQEIAVNSKIESLDGFSAHADYKELLSWLGNFKPKPKKVFITHGEEQESKAFSKRVEDIGIKTYVPTLNEKLSL
jgi:metallo-beta-lactamase family protein